MNRAPSLSKALFWGQKTRNTKGKKSCLYEPQAPTTSCLCPVDWSVEQTLPPNLEAPGKHSVCILSKKGTFQGFPDGSVVKNLPANAGDMGLIPGPGRPHVMKQLSPCATTTETERPRILAAQPETPLRGEACATREQPPPHRHERKTRAATKTLHSHK